MEVNHLTRYVVMIETIRNEKPWMKIVANVGSKSEADNIATDWRAMPPAPRVIVRKVGKRKKKRRR